MSLKGPKLQPDSPDFPAQLQEHLDLLWEAIDGLKGVGGRTIRLLGPLDMRGLPVLNTAPSFPALHDSTHELSGTDELDVTGLGGLLADDQTPLLMSGSQRGGAKLGDVFVLASEVLTLSLKTSYGIQKIANELALKKQSVVEACTTADASDLATVITLANDLKTLVNAVIAALKLAEVIADYQGWFHQRYFATGYFVNGYFAYAA